MVSEMRSVALGQPASATVVTVRLCKYLGGLQGHSSDSKLFFVILLTALG